MNNAGTNVVDLVEQQAALYPEQPAVVSRTGQISYAELVKSVSRVSGWLLERELTPGTPVAVCVERSSTWVVAMLAVLRSGCVYVPLNPMSALPRKTSVLEESRIRLLLTETQTIGIYPASVEVQAIDALPVSVHSSEARPPVLPGQKAYQICTSGSTALPKTVVVGHESLSAYVHVLQTELGVGRTDRYLQTASMEFSASMRQVFAPLASGATLVIAPQEEIRDPARLVFRMLQAGITVLDTVPSYLAQWLNAVWELSRDSRRTLSASLKMVLTTGEPLLATTVNSLAGALPTTRVFNLYGQTETTGTIAIHKVDLPSSDPIPIGLPLGNNEFYILNEESQPATEGELYVSGPCLASSYLLRPDITADRFVHDPFSSASGARMYRTGDRVRRLGNGLLQFIGRTDRQVKFHGIRMDLDEIELALRSHPDILHAAVVVRPKGAGESRIVAFVLLRAGTGRPSEQALRAFVQASLGEAMTPGMIAFINEVPRTQTGKTDYLTLMSMELARSGSESSSPLPSTATERLIAKCWEDTLQVTGVATEDDFFALGGDSLQAIGMLNLLQKRLPRQLPLGGLFFQDPTLHSFAEAIDEATSVT